MKKQYFLIFFTIISFFAVQTLDAQSLSSTTPKIEGLTIYPNPVSAYDNEVSIASKSNLTKTVKVFNVLGKQVLFTRLIGKTLNISKLSKGVYILHITENQISETRKLIIK